MAKKKKEGIESASSNPLVSLSTSYNNLSGYLVLLLGALLFFPPLYRGMFFREEFNFVHMATAIIFLLFYQFVFVKKQEKFMATPLDYTNFALVICYVLAIFVAINKDGSIAFTWRQINYFALYWLAAHVVRSTRDVKTILKFMYASGLAVAVITLGAMTGLWNYNAAYQDGLVQTTLQYKNAGAIFLTALSLIGYYFWAYENKPGMRAFWGIGNYIYMFIIFGSQSRAVWVLYPILYALLVIGFPKGKKLLSVFNFTLIVMLTFALSSQAYQKVLAGNPTGSWIYLFAGFIIVAGLQFLVRYASEIKINTKALISGGVALVLVFLAIVFVLQSKSARGDVASFLPANIVAKVKTLSLKERNVSERTYFWHDALKMIKERPVLGYGGGGWRSGYREFASYHYNSNEEHNHYLKVFVETGILGLLSYIGIWLSFLLLIIKYFFRSGNEEDKPLIWLIGVSAIALGAHSFFDFDLSLGAVAIVLWTLFGLARGLQRIENAAAAKPVKSAVQPRWQQAVVWLVGLVFFIGAFSTMASFGYYDSAVEAGQSQDVENYIGDLEKAITYNPFNAQFYSEAAQVLTYRAEQQSSSADYDKALEYVQKATSIESKDPRWHQVAAYVFFRGNRFSETLEESETTVKLNPFGPASYETVATNYVQTALRMKMNSENPEQANVYAKEVTNVYKRIDEQLAKLNTTEQELQNTGNGFAISPKTFTAVGQAYALLGDYKKAMDNLNKSPQPDPENYFWKGLVYEKNGDMDNAQLNLSKAYADPSFRPVHDQILKLLP